MNRLYKNVLVYLICYDIRFEDYNAHDKFC